MGLLSDLKNHMKGQKHQILLFWYNTVHLYGLNNMQHTA